MDIVEIATLKNDNMYKNIYYSKWRNTL